MRTITTVICAGVFALGFGVASAFAQGNAGVDQYTEHIPSGGGDEPTKTTGSKGSSDSPDGAPSVLTPRQVAALEAEGADGKAVAELAEATGPPRAQRAGDGSRPAGSSHAAAEKSGITGIVAGIAGGDGSGLGPVLPILLIATVLAAVAYVTLRRMRSRPDA